MVIRVITFPSADGHSMRAALAMPELRMYDGMLGAIAAWGPIKVGYNQPAAQDSWHRTLEVFRCSSQIRLIVTELLEFVQIFDEF